MPCRGVSSESRLDDARGPQMFSDEIANELTYDEVCSHRLGCLDNTCRASMWDEYERSTTEIVSLLEGQYEWCCDFVHAPTGSAATGAQSVRFDDLVQINLKYEDEVREFSVHLDRVHELLRECWQLYGFGSSMQHTCRVLCSAMENDASISGNGLQFDSSGSDGRSPELPAASHDSHSSLSQQEFWNDVAGLRDGFRRVRRIQTWLLIEGYAEVCEFSRSVSIRPSMSFADFEQVCRSRWSDVIFQAPIDWHLVRGQADMPHDGLHVVIAQNQARMSCSHIVHYDPWPILAKYRAVMFEPGMPVADVLLKVRANLPRSQVGGQLVVSFQEGNAIRTLDSQDPVYVGSATVLHARVQVVHPWDASSDEEASVDSSVSTDAPSSQELVESDDDIFSATMLALTSFHFDPRGAYPWEIDDPEVLPEQDEEDEVVPGLVFMENDRFQMNQHVQYLAASLANQNDEADTWVAVTYGVGLTDLGRRDVEFRRQDIERLPTMIQELWGDHLQYGDPTLYFVTPQPERQHVKPCLVFLVAISYNSELGTDERWILVREMSPDQSMIAQRPYGAVVSSWLTSRAIMAQLGHHECFPLGARDCYVRIAGRWLEQDEYHNIRNGDLCDAYVGAYPSYVEEAAETVLEAEALFKVARAHFENLPGSAVLTLRVHGVSPLNQPLGYRDVHIDYPDLATLAWIPQVLQLWPFRPEFAKCVYVPRGDIEDGGDIYQPTMHLIVSYVFDPDGVPVLVKQKIHSIEGDKDVDEVWAVVIPRTADATALKVSLDRKPFWFHPDARTHIRRDDRYVEDVLLDWSAGDIVALRVNVVRPEYLLSALWDMSTRSSSSYPADAAGDTMEAEEASLLQIGHQHGADSLVDSHTTGQRPFDLGEQDPFEEICRACMVLANQFDEQVQQQTHFSDACQDECEPEGVESEQKQSKVLVSLEHMLVDSSPALDLNTHCAQVFDEGNWLQLFRRPWPNPLSWLPEGMQVHPQTWEALHEQKYHDMADVTRVDLYIDGATGSDRAAWAVVVVTHAANGDLCQGVMSGCVCTDPNSVEWIGAQGNTNITAEVSALVVAQAYALTLPASLHVVIRPDLRLSKQIADLQVTLRNEKVLGGVSACLARMPSCPAIVEEVRAHKGHPWNELADGAAKQAARTNQGVGCIPWTTLHALACSRDDQQWAWLQQAETHLRAVFPPIFDDKVMQFSPPETDTVPKVCKAEAHESEVTVGVNIYSLNVLALDEKEAGYIGSRVLRIDQQMHERNGDILCLQEARTQQGQRLTDHYLIYSSGGAGRNSKQFLGCEIWLNRFKPIAHRADGTQIKWPDFKICAVVADPRRLVLCLSGPMNMTIASLHAPCLSRGHTLQDIDDWWQNTESLLSKYKNGIFLVGCDANAPLASIASRHHGLVGAESSNEQGGLFEAFLQSLDLVAPSTFECHEGAHGTWKHPRGKLLRRDYVLVSADLISAVGSSKVVSDVDLGFSHVDHYPVKCELRFAQLATRPNSKIKWDRKKMMDPKCCQQFQSDLHCLPIPRWDVDVDAHNHYFNVNVRALAIQHFTADPKKSKLRPQLQESTQNLIAFKRQVLQCLRNAEGESLEELKIQLKAIEKQIRPMILRDQRKWYDEWVCELDLQNKQHNTAEVYRMLERLGRRRKVVADGPRPLPLLRRSDGSYVGSHGEMQALWCEMFAQTEAGLKVEEQDLIDLHLASDCSPVDLDMRLLPGLQDLQQIIRSMKNGRVPGPNGLLVEMLKAGGECLAKHLLPIVAKASLRCREPLEWKGGLLVPLFKGRGDPRNPSSFRSIFVSDCTAKVHHKWLRRSLEAKWTQDQHSLQLGGRPGIGCDLAHHCVQAAVAWCRSKNLSYSAMFLDLKAAFYSVHRGAIFSGPWDDRMLCLAMECHGITPSDWHEVRKQVEVDCATAGISDHAERVFRDLFHPTYFRMADVSAPTLTTRGSRPGDPVADIIFNMLFGIILRQARQAFLEATDFQWVGQPQPVECLAHLPSLPSRGLLDLAYVDDAVFLLYSQHADEIMGATQLMASIIHDESRKRGLEVNYSAGKTEVMIKFAGKGSYGLKQKLWHEMGGTIPVVTEEATQTMTVVHSYKHLGTVIQEHAAPVREVAQRITMARKAEGRIHRSFYAKACVSLYTKCQVFQATVCSRLMYNMHVLCWISAKDIARWEDGLRNVVGSLCRAKLARVPPFKLSTVNLFALAGMLPPSDALHINRLKYCRKLIQTGPQCLWSMLLDTQTEHAWINALSDSFRWLQRFGPPTCRALPHNIHDMLTMIAVDERFGAKVTSAKHSCFCYREQTAIATVKQMDLAISLHRCGLPCVDGGEKVEKWSCMLCDSKFASKRSLAIHSIHAHGYKKRARFWVGCDECLVCKKKYYTRARALVHFQSSARCLEIYVACFPPMEAEQVACLDEQEKQMTDELKGQGWWATKALVPISVLPGPSLPQPGTADAISMKAKWELRSSTGEAAYQNFAGTCDEIEVANDAGACHESILAFVGQSNGGACEGHSGVFQQAGLARLCAQVNLKCRLFLHVFSGHRRHRDLQDQLEALSSGDTRIFCVSLDICLARENVDLLSPEVLQYWKGKMRDGWVAGVGGGPPCETFTAARYHEGGPPPLRSYFEPWGLPALTKKQWKQVSVGTALVFALLDLLYEAAMLGLAGFAEHPAFPTWVAKKQPASIWMWDSVRNLTKLACCQITTFDQCVHQCDGKKPTSILTIRLPKFRQLVQQRGSMGRCNHGHRHIALIGKETNGSYRTQRAKIYPALLNADLAEAIHGFLKVTAVQPCTQYPGFLAVEPVPEYVPLDQVQRDYHG